MSRWTVFQEMFSVPKPESGSGWHGGEQFFNQCFLFRSRSLGLDGMEVNSFSTKVFCVEVGVENRKW